MRTSDELVNRSHESRTRSRGDAEHTPWILHGVASGILGAVIVAVFFLAIDVAAGRPFWTPSALGSAFLRGERLPVGAPAEPVLIVGYTVMHGTVFAAIGLIAAFSLASGRRRNAPAGLALAGLLFLAFAAVFTAYSALFDAGLMATYGFGSAAAANLLAAGGMAAYLMRFAHLPAAES